MNFYDFNYRKNTLNSIRFERPDAIPMTFMINDSCWQHYPQEFLFELMDSHRYLFPDFIKPCARHVPDFANVARKDEPYTDDWGCTWETSDDGITGTVTKHPLDDWSAYDRYAIPDPEKCTGIGPADWEQEKADIKRNEEQCRASKGGLVHGHTFLRLSDIRGYQNLMFDMADEEPMLSDLIQKIEDFNLYIINRYADIGTDIIEYPEDLGMQKGPMISPAHFMKYVKPSYIKMVRPAKRKGIIVHMHSDGCLHDLMDDILDCGMDVMNLQDIVNGVDWIRDRLYGKVCIELDIDRQYITAKGDPGQIDSLIRDEVEKLGSKEGGLMMIYGLYPGVPKENVKAIMDAMERYAFYFI